MSNERVPIAGTAVTGAAGSDRPGEPTDGADEHTYVRLPSITGGRRGEVVVALSPEGLLIGGDPDGVESYLDRLRAAAGERLAVAGLESATGGEGFSGLVAGAAGMFGRAGKFVALGPESLQAIRERSLIPGATGLFRLVNRAADSPLMQQLQWRPAALNPLQRLATRLLVMQLAVETAVCEVEAAVRRVESKVDSLLNPGEPEPQD